jgi:hypothetical protein
MKTLLIALLWIIPLSAFLAWAVSHQPVANAVILVLSQP